MMDAVKLDCILFLDIETVPQYADFQSVPEAFRAHWERKTEVLKLPLAPEETYQRAGIYAEFGKIVCVSVGYFKTSGQERQFRIKSFCGDNEKELLESFVALLNTHFNRKESNLCGHNAREFDFPYLSRRMLINGIRLPALLDIAGKKPWDICLLDTMDLWKFGDYKSYTSLSLLAAVFGIPTPKDDMSGKDVCDVYWKEHDLARIAGYCQKDVLTVAQIFLSFRNERLLSPEEILFINQTNEAGATT
jgi:3'-5' exonuclease